MVKKVLIITYFFPPRPGVASLRLGGLAKYLPEFGWEPTIITARLLASPDPLYRVIETEDSDVLIEWKRRLGFSVNKTFREELGETANKDTIIDFFLNCAKEILAYPDYNKGWYKYVILIASKVLESEKFDAIISSAGPYTGHIIAHDLKKESGIPWVADFRDLWTQNHNYLYSRVRKYFETKLEVRILTDADAITTVSQPLADKLHLLHCAPVYVVPNGFDPDFVNYNASLSQKFSINYTGRIYRGKMDLELLFKIIRRTIDWNLINPSFIEIHFWGFFEPWLHNLVERYSLDAIVNIHESVPHEQAIKIQQRSQLLLLLTWNDPEEEGIITGKVFEYLAARRPILSIGYSKGVINELLIETQAGVVAEDEYELEEALMNYYNEYKVEGRVRYAGIDSKIEQYSHREMARKLVGVFEEISKEDFD